MSVRTRLEDAQVLADAGRREGAFIQVLISAASTSKKKRYRREIWDDEDSFKNSIYDELGIITGGPNYGVILPLLGKEVPLEDILYQHLRCRLVHEGEMPASVEFTEPRQENGKTVHAMNLGTPLGFPAGWIERLATAVRLAPENDDLWPDEAERRQKAAEQLGDLHETHLYCRRPGQQTKAMKGKNERLSWPFDGVPLRLSYPPGVSPQKLADGLEAKANDLRR